MSSSTAPSGPEDRGVLRRVIGRILLGIALVVIFLFALVYCTSHAGKPSDPGSATPTLPAFTGSARPTPAATTLAVTTTAPLTTATTAARNLARAPGAGGSKTSTARAAGSRSTPARSRSGPAPRSAPNTGGGSDSGTVDVRLVSGGTLLLAASIALGLVTLRRWRRAW